MPNQQPNPDPTPEEIAAACREIRKTWSAEETLQRRADYHRPTPYAIPEVPTPPNTLTANWKF